MYNLVGLLNNQICMQLILTNFGYSLVVTGQVSQDSIQPLLC